MEVLNIFIVMLLSLGISIYLTARDMEKDIFCIVKLNIFKLSGIFLLRWLVFTTYLIAILMIMKTI